MSYLFKELNADGTFRLDGSLIDKANGTSRFCGIKTDSFYFIINTDLNSNKLDLINID